jgi:hypothetical protein
MHWYRIVIGFALSVFGADVVIHPLLNWYMWPQIAKHHGETKASGTSFTRQVGWLERALYTGALLVGAWQWVGIWLAIKVAARWRSTSGDTGTPVDNIWLMGTGLSVLFGFLGAWLAGGHIPPLGKP